MEAVFVPLSFFGAITLCIVLPIYFRNRLYQKALDVVGLAIQQGVEPERVRLPQFTTDKDDVNGNWKAGVILIVIGLIFLLAVALPLYATGEVSSGDDGGFAVFFPGVTCIGIGATLLWIHRTIVGSVVKKLPGGQG